MAPYVRKVKTASGATAVQIAQTVNGRRTIVEHIGSAHTDAELAALVATARSRINAGQEHLDLDLPPTEKVRSVGEAVIAKHSSELLCLLWVSCRTSPRRLSSRS